MKRVIGLVVIVIFILSVQSVFAGPIRDLIAKRLASRQSAGAQNTTGESSEASSNFALPPGAKVLRDISYGADPAQRMDVYIPQNVQNAPIIFMVHGGAWIMGDKGHSSVIQNKVSRWLPKGIIIVSTNYRMLPKTRVADQAKDVAMALAKAQSRSEEHTSELTSRIRT